MSDLSNLIIKNHYHQQEPGMIVSWNYTDVQINAGQAPQNVMKKHYAIQVRPKNSNYRICAEDITISGVPGLTNNSIIGQTSGNWADYGYTYPNNWSLDLINVLQNNSGYFANPFVGNSPSNTFYQSSGGWFSGNSGPGTLPRYMFASELLFEAQYGTQPNTIAEDSYLEAFHAFIWYDTQGVDSDGIGLPQNKVVVIVLLADGWQAPNWAVPASMSVDIDGTATQVPSAMIPPPVPVNFNAGINIMESANLTITPTNETSISSTQEVEDGGFSTQKEKLIFSGKAKTNTPTKITSIKIEANSGYYLSKKPSLETTYDDNIKMVVSGSTKSSGRITSYTVDIIYSNSSRTFSSNYPEANITCKAKLIYVRPVQLDSFVVKSTIIDSEGENRTILITGAPGATFGVAINENFLDKEVDLVTSEERVITHKQNDLSILSPSNITSSYDYGYGKKLPVFTGTINKKGLYKFSQRFPSVQAIKTKTNASKVGASTITVDSNAGIMKGDKVYARQFTTSTPKVNSVSGANDVVLDQAVTIGDNEAITFKRNKRYSVDLIPDLTSTFGPKIPTSIPTYTLNQYAKPVLTLRLTEGHGSSFTITKFNNVATSLSAGADHDYNITGKTMTTERIKRTISYLITCSSNITAVTTPTFSSIRKQTSSWTNSISLDNGGTAVEVTNFSHSATGSTTITLTFDLTIKRWGTKDVTMALDLDNVLTHA